MNARNPIFSDSESLSVTLEYNHPDYGWIPFTATPDDVEPLGRDLYKRAKAGEFGPVRAYEGPSDVNLAAQTARERRGALLIEVDAVVSNPLRWGSMSEAEQQAWADYRQALLDVPQQDDFPHNIDWPEAPNA